MVDVELVLVNRKYKVLAHVSGEKIFIGRKLENGFMEHREFETESQAKEYIKNHGRLNLIEGVNYE